MNERIVIVDDDETIRELVTLILNEEGYEVINLEAVTTVEQLAELKPDLIILDVKMPHLGGVELSNLLKNSTLTKTIPIMALSATLPKEREGLRFDAFLAKPFNIDELLAQVATLLQPVAKASPLAFAVTPQPEPGLVPTGMRHS